MIRFAGSLFSLFCMLNPLRLQIDPTRCFTLLPCCMRRGESALLVELSVLSFLTQPISFFSFRVSSVNNLMKPFSSLRSRLIPLFAASLFSSLICGCGDGGGPVASEDEVTAYLTAHPELKKDLDSGSAIVAMETTSRAIVAAP